jgi:hypothetical protein
LIKIHTDHIHKVVIGVSLFGFLLMSVGLIIGFIDFANSRIISYIASGSGILTEFIASIFFALYNRTVRQMKEYHNSLLDEKNMLLLFKLVADVQDEKERAKIVDQIANNLTNKQSQLTVANDTK